MNSLALISGHVLTGHPWTSDEEAVLIEHGRVRLVGCTADVLAARSAESSVVDLAGRTVLPGLIDAHTHVENCALSRRWLDVRRAERQETIDRLSTAIAGGVDGWLVAQGTFGQDLPSRADLDRISGGIPVLVRESMHRLVANSSALQRAGIVRGFTSPVGTLVELDETGEPTGVVEEGFHLFPVPPPPPAILEELLSHELQQSFARHGVTTIYELPATAEGVRAYQRLHSDGRLSTRLSLTLTIAPGINATLTGPEQLTSAGLSSGFGDDDFWINGVKVFLDGDDSSSLDSTHLHKTPSRWGTPTRHYSELVRLLVDAYGGGLQVWIHAIGDIAQRLALDAIDEAGRVCGPADRRTRLEHVANTWVDDDLIHRLTDLEVTPVPTAAFIHSDALGGVYAFRTLIEAGLQPPGNSDTGGTQPFATNPWFGIARMLDRRSASGALVAADEAVDVDTALRTYTEFGAYAGFREHSLGSLDEGMLGDCAVYERNPLTLAPDELSTLEADLTIVGGRIVWNREDQS